MNRCGVVEICQEPSRIGLQRQCLLPDGHEGKHAGLCSPIGTPPKPYPSLEERPLHPPKPEAE